MKKSGNRSRSSRKRAARVRKPSVNARRNRTTRKLAVMPVSVKQQGASTKATIPVAVTDSAGFKAASLTTAEIPVAVRATGKGRGRRKSARPEVVPVALSTRKARARKHRSRRTSRRVVQVHREPNRVNDVVTRMVLAASRAEENAVTLLAQAGITASGIVETIARSLLVVPRSVQWRESDPAGPLAPRVPLIEAPVELASSVKAPSPLLAA